MKKGGTFQKSFTEEGINEAIKNMSPPIDDVLIGKIEYKKITTSPLINIFLLKPPDDVIIIDIQDELCNLEDYYLLKIGEIHEFSHEDPHGKIIMHYINYTCFIKNKETKTTYYLSVAIQYHELKIIGDSFYDIEFEIFTVSIFTVSMFMNTKMVSDGPYKKENQAFER